MSHTRQACSGLAPVSHPLRVELHAVQDLPRLGVVLLHFLVPGIPQECAPLQPGVDRQIRLDSVYGRRRRQPAGRLGMRHPDLMLSAIPAVLAPDVWVSIGLISIAMAGY